VNLGKKGQAAKPDEIEANDFQKGTAMTMNKEAAKTNNLYLRAALATLMALALAASLLARIAGPAEAAFPGQNGTWAANPVWRSELCGMLHMDFGELPFHALR